MDVEVTAATEAVAVDAEIFQHEQALLYWAASAHRELAYAGIVLVGVLSGESESDAVCVTTRFSTGEVNVGVHAGGSVVTVTVTGVRYVVSHVVLRVEVQRLTKRADLGRVEA